MSGPVLVDAGPLIAILNPRDAHYTWANQIVEESQPPWLTCEAVISESSYLLRDIPGAQDALLETIERRAIQVPFDLDAEAAHVRRLMNKYRDLPMSLADACLVRMAELNAGSKVVTLDRHFTIYRKNNRQVIPTIMPSGR
jgi:predicted nucleic acid-binding protein